MSKYEKVFEKIAQEALLKAEGVECDPEDFIAGLKDIASIFADRVEGAKEEFGIEDDDDDFDEDDDDFDPGDLEE